MPKRMIAETAGAGQRPLGRRVLLTMTTASLFGLHGAARAQTAVAQTVAALPGTAEIAKLLAGRTAKPGGITLDVPAIAENGLVVPLTVDVASPMTDADYVKVVHVVAEGNPNPLVASFHFTPASGRPAASIRIRVAQTQNIVVIAETSTGALHMASAEVKVTIGGCGG